MQGHGAVRDAAVCRARYAHRCTQRPGGHRCAQPPADLLEGAIHAACRASATPDAQLRHEGEAHEGEALGGRPHRSPDVRTTLSRWALATGRLAELPILLISRVFPNPASNPASVSSIRHTQHTASTPWRTPWHTQSVPQDAAAATASSTAVIVISCSTALAVTPNGSSLRASMATPNGSASSLRMVLSLLQRCGPAST